MLAWSPVLVESDTGLSRIRAHLRRLLGSAMGRLSAVFITFCMLLIAGSVGIVTYLSFGFSGVEARMRLR